MMSSTRRATYVPPEELPQGVRPKGKDFLFQTPNADDRITPDRVGPVVEGYFHVPPVWIGVAPDPLTVLKLNAAIHHAAAIERDLSCGIKARANRDGLFLFDFTRWAPGAPVVIPGFIRPDTDGAYRYPNGHNDAERKAEDAAILRAQVMNAHQALLTTAERMLKNRAAGMGFPVTAWSTHKALDLQTAPPYHDDWDNFHSFVQNAANNKDRAPREKSKPRRSLEIEVVDLSFSMLDALLTGNDLTGVRLVEGAFMATNRRREKRFGEAITLGWTVCEQIVAIAWKKMLDIARSEHDDRMSKERRKKLTGRDYTASVMTEMLELRGLLSYDTFRMLEIARKARNAWAHEMRAPPEREVQVCMKAIEALMKSILGIDLRLDGGGRGGVPQWPVWFWPGFNPSA